MKCWQTILAWLLVIGGVQLVTDTGNLTAAQPFGAGSAADSAGLVAVHDTHSGAVVGYIDAQEREVFNAQHQYAGSWDKDGTYDAQGNQVLDQPMPGVLLGQNTVAAMPDGQLINRVAVQQIPIAAEIIRNSALGAAVIPVPMGVGRTLIEDERLEHAHRRALVEQKKAEQKALAELQAEKQLAQAERKKQKQLTQAERKEEHQEPHTNKGASKEKHAKVAKA